MWMIIEQLELGLVLDINNMMQMYFHNQEKKIQKETK